MSIEISREDILSEYICDYSAEDKFLKLPVEPYMELLGITPLPSQVAIINAINNPKYRFVCAAISRRQGKTYIANIIGQVSFTGSFFKYFNYVSKLCSLADLF